MPLNNNSIDSEDLSPDDPLFWSRPTTVNCHAVRIVGIFLCMGSLAGIIVNGSLVVSFIRYKALRSPPNMFLMFIAIMGLIASCTILPLTGVSSIYCQWVFQRAGCIFDAVIAFFHGTASCYLLCAVSISRCYIIVRPYNANRVTVKKCVYISIVMMIFGFLWTMFPLMGWNEYTIEQARISCCINWTNQRPLYVSYTLSLFVLIYCVPLAILTMTNAVTLFGLKQMHDKIQQGVQTALSAKRIEMERRIAKSIIMTIFGFLLTWTPYTVAFFLAAFRGQGYGTPPAVAFVCACFAKSSVVWIPMIYAGTSTQFEWSFVKLNALEVQENNNRVGVGHTLTITNRGVTLPHESIQVINQSCVY